MNTLQRALAFLLWMPLAWGTARAQSDIDDVLIDLDAVPDLTMVFRARPPMGACPMGETDEAKRLPAGSHLLHLGVPRLFLDYRRRLKLSDEQVGRLQDARSRALEAWSKKEAAVSALELRVWELTGAEDPDMADVQRVIGEIEDQRVAQRFAYVSSVLEASRILTSQQRSRLVGPVSDSQTNDETRHPAP